MVTKFKDFFHKYMEKKGESVKFDTEDFYREVNRIEYHSKVGSDIDGKNFRVDFEKTDKVSLGESLKDCKLRWKLKRRMTNYLSDNMENHYYDYLKMWSHKTSKVSEIIFIFKVPDDYFIVYWKTETKEKNKKSKYYICDQVNGLIKLLKDNKVI